MTISQKRALQRAVWRAAVNTCLALGISFEEWASLHILPHCDRTGDGVQGKKKKNMFGNKTFQEIGGKGNGLGCLDDEQGEDGFEGNDEGDLDVDFTKYIFVEEPAKKKNKRKRTDKRPPGCKKTMDKRHDGKEICRDFNLGRCKNSCPHGRLHICNALLKNGRACALKGHTLKECRNRRRL